MGEKGLLEVAKRDLCKMSGETNIHQKRPIHTKRDLHTKRDQYKEIQMY